MINVVISSAGQSIFSDQIARSGDANELVAPWHFLTTQNDGRVVDIKANGNSVFAGSVKDAKKFVIDTAKVWDGKGTEIIFGTPGADDIHVPSGPFSVYTGDGNDKVTVHGSGPTNIYLGAGDDFANVRFGVDHVNGGSGTDSVVTRGNFYGVSWWGDQGGHATMFNGAKEIVTDLDQVEIVGREDGGLVPINDIIGGGGF